MIFQKNYTLKIGMLIIIYLFMGLTFISKTLAVDTQLTLAETTRNPFAPTEQILSGMVPSHTDDSRPTFVSSGALTRLPPLKLRGIVKPGDQSTVVALLEVGGTSKQIHMVKIGDEIAFDRSDPSLVFKIREINRLSVIVEVGTLGDMIIVR
jgi:hypothetical protein